MKKRGMKSQAERLSRQVGRWPVPSWRPNWVVSGLPVIREYSEGLGESWLESHVNDVWRTHHVRVCSSPNLAARMAAGDLKERWDPPNVRWKTPQNWVEPFSITAHTGMELTGKVHDDLLLFEPTHEGAWLEPTVIAVLQVRCAAASGIPWNSGSA